MSRVQLALNVTDVDAAVDFYTKLFATPVNKRKPGYANFAIAEPPLKLVLIEGEGGGTLNHLGVEVETAEEVEAAEGRLSTDGVETTGVSDTTCCYALKTETWVSDPDGAPWEWYVKTGDAEQMANSVIGSAEGTCCAPAATPAAEPVGLGAPSGVSNCATDNATGGCC